MVVCGCSKFKELQMMASQVKSSSQKIELRAAVVEISGHSNNARTEEKGFLFTGFCKRRAVAPLIASIMGGWVLIFRRLSKKITYFPVTPRGENGFS